MTAYVLVLSVSVLTLVRGQDQFASDCPTPHGFFADSVQCDKYYHCADNVITEKLCPDGKVFNDLNSNLEKCDFSFQVTCEGRPELQPPRGTGNCPRKNGYFPHPDQSVCDKFFYCHDDVGSLIICPEGLAFSLKTGTCVWPDEAGRADCKSENVVNFTCPKVPLLQAVAHPRYADPNDCQFFYVCVNGKTPRHNGCGFGKVYNSNTSACDDPKNVLECVDYYKEYLEEYFSTLDGGLRPSQEILQAAMASGFPIPDAHKRIRIDSSKIPSRRRKPSEENLSSPKSNPSEVTGRRPASGDKQVPVLIRQNLEHRAQPPEEASPAPIFVRRPTERENQEAGQNNATAQSPQRKRPGQNSLLRLAGRRKKTTTTTTTTSTTTAPPPSDYYYYDYDEYAAGGAAEEPSSPSRGGLVRTPAA